MSELSQSDKFSKISYLLLPWTVPLIVGSSTFLFYSFVPKKLIFIPLVIIYWLTTWSYTILFHKKRGGVLTKERYKFTLKLQGEKSWLQYLLLYGPVIYTLPLFFIQYGGKMSVAMWAVLILVSAINGPTEEGYWRGCLEEAGKKAGYSELHRFFYTTIAFALWHTAFVIHLYPMDSAFLMNWGIIIITTFLSGLIWIFVLQKSGRVVPQSLFHIFVNIFSVFPMLMIDVIQLQF